ncbi:MAG: ATP phosphoribosyltransferase regulatory subunit [Marinilabiliales bacterium]|nr:ATP phosphoribosyltransferase regulatory subunit [Marinilabiliales bacterium]
MNTVVKLNNRKILAGIAEIIGEPDKMIDITVAIDKLDKIGKKGVYDELIGRGVSSGSVSLLDPILELAGDNFAKLSSLKEILKNSEIGLKGITEVETVLNYFNSLPLETSLELDLTLARGLNYYTGAIIEVKAKDVEIGSICGGGRYDDLTGVFGLKDVSGVGVSFGADRIYDVMQQLDIFPKEIVSSTKVLFVNFGEKEELYCLPLLKTLRDNGISAEIYPESGKNEKANDLCRQ